MEICFGNLYMECENYEFSLSKADFLRALELVIEKEWITVEKLTQVIINAAS